MYSIGYIPSTDRKNVIDFLYLVLHWSRKVTRYFRLFSSVLVSVLRTSINVISKSKPKNYVTWIANLTKLFLSVLKYQLLRKWKIVQLFSFYCTGAHYTWSTFLHGSKNVHTPVQ